jgi:hypothetical protein
MEGVLQTVLVHCETRKRGLLFVRHGQWPREVFVPIDESASDFLTQCARLLKDYDPRIDEHNAVVGQIRQRLLDPISHVLVWADTHWGAMSIRFPCRLKKGDQIDWVEAESLANMILGGFLQDKVFRQGSLAAYGALDAAMGTTNWPDEACLGYLVGRKQTYDPSCYPSVWQWVSRKLGKRTNHQLCQRRHEDAVGAIDDPRNATSRNAQQSTPSLSIADHEYVNILACQVLDVILEARVAGRVSLPSVRRLHESREREAVERRQEGDRGLLQR